MKRTLFFFAGLGLLALLSGCSKVQVTPPAATPAAKQTDKLPPGAIYPGFAALLPNPSGPGWWADYHGIPVFVDQLIYKLGPWNEGDLAILTAPITVSFNGGAGAGITTVDISYDDDGSVSDADFEYSGTGGGSPVTYNGIIIRTSLSSSTFAVIDGASE